MLAYPSGPQVPAHTAAAPVAVGWECPRCHATFAPWMATCSNCAPAAASLRERMQKAAPRVPSLSGPLPLVECVGTDATGR